MLKKAHSFWQELLKNKYVYLMQLLLTLAIAVDYAIGVNIDHVLGNWFYVLPVAGSLLANVTLFSDWRVYKSKDLVLFIYHFLVALFLIIMTPIFGPYFQLFILLLFASAYWYRWRGLVASLLVVLSVTLIAVWQQYGELNSSLIITSFIRWLILVVIGSLFALVSTRQSPQQADSKLLESISFERTRLLSLINSMADAVVATNRKGQILLYNGAALDLFNTHVSLENKYLQSILQLYDDKNLQVDVILEADKANRVVKRDDLHFKSNEEQEVNIYISVSPVRSGFAQNDEQGFIIVMRDITKEKTLDEERDEFVSVTSHELRTPIAITEANISTALLPEVSGKLDPKVRELLNQAHQNIVFLGDLVNDLTTLARAERDDLKVAVSQIDPVAILKGLEHNYQAEAKTKGLTLQVDPAANAKPINSSELYVREVLQNFVTNALKYTSQGGISMSVKSTADGSACFSVKDTGIGISAQDKKKVFGKFYRAEDYRTRKTRGTGLGLYITTKLAQRIRATIWFESEINKGSTFYLQVPNFGPSSDKKVVQLVDNPGTTK